jgi:hypothetical protein
VNLVPGVVRSHRQVERGHHARPQRPQDPAAVSLRASVAVCAGGDQAAGGVQDRLGEGRLRRKVGGTFFILSSLNGARSYD